MAATWSLRRLLVSPTFDVVSSPIPAPTRERPGHLVIPSTHENHETLPIFPSPREIGFQSTAVHPICLDGEAHSLKREEEPHRGGRSFSPPPKAGRPGRRGNVSPRSQLKICLDIEVLAYELLVDWVHCPALQGKWPGMTRHPVHGVATRGEEKVLNTPFDSRKSKNYDSIMELRNHN